MPSDAPLFTIRHAIEIDASPDTVWSTLVDFDRYGEWNPYVLALQGPLSIGARLDVTIVQANWPQPIVVTPVLTDATPPRCLSWHGQVGDGGLLDTDHSFEIEVIGDGRVRFIQQETFRGSLAETMNDEARSFTRDAFEAMNEALAKRVTTSTATAKEA